MRSSAVAGTDAGKANAALAPLFPIMIALTLLVIVLQTRSLAATTMVFLTALAAVLAFIPLTTSVFWGSMAYTLIGGTVLILVFLPALYAIWFKVRPSEAEPSEAQASEARIRREAVAGSSVFLG